MKMVLEIAMANYAPDLPTLYHPEYNHVRPAHKAGIFVKVPSSYDPHIQAGCFKDGDSNA
jgi:hypothetical protein